MEERSRSAPLPRSRQKEYQRVELRECGATRAPSWQRKGGILKVANTEKDERCNTEDALGWEARGFWQELPDDQQSASSQSGLFGESSGWPMHTLLHWRWRRRCNVKCTVPVFLSQQKTSLKSAQMCPQTRKSLADATVHLAAKLSCLGEPRPGISGRPTPRPSKHCGTGHNDNDGDG
jgi:hypothetical protein